jgi:hypothetical protein
MKQFLLGSLCTLCVVIVGGLVYMWLGLAEVRGDTPPSRLESSLMQMAVHASVRRQAPNVPNPIPATEDNLIAGGEIYLNECAGCHGAPGKPNEPDSLNPAAPRLAQVGTGYSEAQIFWVGEAWHPANGNVCERHMGFRSEAVDSSGLHPSHKEPAAAGKAGNRQGSTRRQLDHVQVSAAKHALFSIQH